MKHYLYRHIRLDKDEVFYIGIGTISKKYKYSNILYQHYNRAYNKIKRSNIWKRVVIKTDYLIEIIYESDDYSLIKEKEKEFIKLYGRKDLKTGTLVNLTDGGEGVINYIFSLEVREKIKIKATGRKWSKEYKQLFKQQKLGKKHSEDHKIKAAKGKHKSILQYDLEGNFIKEWESSKLACNLLNMSTSNLCRALKKVQKTSNGFIWKYKYENKI